MVGGNVSLYNEGADGPIYPTPVVGMVGELPDAARAGRRASRPRATRSPSSGRSPVLHGSELAKLRGEPLPRRLPDFDVPAIRAAQSLVREAVRAGPLASAHDIAEGGLAVALAECCLAGGLGARIELIRPRDALRGAVRRGPGRLRRPGAARPCAALGGGRRRA